ncbi:MAG: glycosyltransferase, partial [Candidatus Spechtbacterales bacterium]
LSQFDMVISSSSFFSKGVITRVGAVHISYCHTPTRKLWAERPVAGEAGSLFSTPSAHMLRLWDANAAARVDYFIANSRHTKRAIGKYYRRDAFVVYPPVDARALAYTRSLDEREQRLVDGLPENFYLVVSALYPHKRVRLAVEAFSKLSYPLVIIGAGPQQDHLERLAGEGTVLLGRQSDAVVAACYERCRALVHPAEDDFGIAPVEAMQYGKPVVAYRKGGVTETVVDHVSGEFFDVAHPAVLADAVRRLEEGYDTLNPALITAIGNRFGKDRFQEELRRVLKRILAHEMHAV